MPERSQGPNSFQDRETSLGGADAVPGTPDVAGHETEPEAPVRGHSTARVSAGGGVALVWWIVAVLVILVLVAYGLGLGLGR
ncbi:MAG TPA: hypothetical protein VFW98_06945 [Gemmatimonadaceae bacterium]|nr:hypothetical protein [Gemmatimonadaceae bacterium]